MKPPRRAARLRLVAWIGVLALVTVALQHLGRGSLAGPPVSPRTWAAWFAGRDPLVASFALLRLAALALAGYLLTVTLLGTATRVLRLARLAAAIDLATLPSVRRIVESAAGVGLALSTTIVAFAGSTVAHASVPPRDTGTMVTAPAPGATGDVSSQVPILRRLPGPGIVGSSSRGDAPVLRRLTVPSSPATTSPAPTSPAPTSPATSVSPRGQATPADTRIGVADDRGPVLHALPDQPAPAMKSLTESPSADAAAPPVLRWISPDPPAVQTPTIPATTIPVGATPITVTLRPGDHLWLVAERALTAADHQQPTNARIEHYWRALIDANRDRLADPANPDLVYAGQILLLPPIP